MIETIRKYVNALEPMLNYKICDGVKFAVMAESDGDACIFNGLLASVWDQVINWPQAAVLASQGESGMWYRSPQRRADDNSGFSRDQAHGVLLSAIMPSMSIRQWDNWIEYIRGSRPCKVKKPKWMGGGCLLRSPIYYYAPDDRSQITPCMWAMMGRVADYRGWADQIEMGTWEGSDGDASVLEAENCELGYRLHLNAVQAFIKLLIGQSREFSQKVGQIAWDRVPDNLFYEFLATRTIDESFIQRFMDVAPDPYSRFGNGWVWQSSSVESELPFSSGWDFVFMGKLILKFHGGAI